MTFHLRGSCPKQSCKGHRCESDLFINKWRPEGHMRLSHQRPNLKNLSGGLNLSSGSNMVGFTKNCIKCFKI